MTLRLMGHMGLVLAASLSSCGPPPPPSRTTAIIAVEADPGHFNPGITTAAQVHAVADSLFNGLVALDEHGDPKPDLAESWSLEDDGRRYVFRLAEGVLWHDGEPFSSADVRFTFEEILLRHHARTRAGLEGIVESIATPDRSTVVFQLKAPYAPFLSSLDVTEAPILPAHVFRDRRGLERHPANLSAVGTGPFRLAHYRRDDRIELWRNADYFKPGLPYLDRLVFRVIPDPETRLLALERGEVDYAGSLRAPDVRRLRAMDELEVVGTDAGPGGSHCIMTWIFNLDRPELAPLPVRRALARAVDRDEILEKVLFGEGRVPEAPFSSGIAWAHHPGVLAPYSFDPRDAAAELDRVEPRLTAIDLVLFPSFRKYGEVMKDQLARVGVDLELSILERAAAVERIYFERDFDTALISYCNGVDPEIGLRRMYDSRAIGRVPFSNGAGYQDPEVDQLFDRAARESERSVRAEIYRRIQEKVASHLPYWWLVETRNLTAYRRRFQDFAPWSGHFAETARPVPEL